MCPLAKENDSKGHHKDRNCNKTAANLTSPAPCFFTQDIFGLFGLCEKLLENNQIFTQLYQHIIFSIIFFLFLTGSSLHEIA